MKDERSNKNLVGVNPLLVAVVERAAQLTTVPFIVTEGLRTQARQTQLVLEGKAQTHKSYHIIGRAVDLAAKPGGWNSTDVSWDLRHYAAINAAMQAAAKELGANITWGGSWQNFVDGPHWQIEPYV